MYAIVSIAGQQFKVEKGKKIFVHRLAEDVGSEINIENVLLIENGNNIKVGTPYVDNAVVSAEILSHVRGDKVLVFKKKRRKGYQVLNGHRQNFTELLIGEITESVIVKKSKAKKAVADSEAQKAEDVITDAPPADVAVKSEEAKKAVAEVKPASKTAKAAKSKKTAESKAKTADKPAKKTAEKKKAAKE